MKLVVFYVDIFGILCGVVMCLRVKCIIFYGEYNFICVIVWVECRCFYVFNNYMYFELEYDKNFGDDIEFILDLIVVVFVGIWNIKLMV